MLLQYSCMHAVSVLDAVGSAIVSTQAGVDSISALRIISDLCDQVMMPAHLWICGQPTTLAGKHTSLMK